jgi:peptidoglycan/LPS O-acetylase OafA/YrhL
MVVNDSDHIRSIDGLRAVAILLVFLSHYGVGRLIPGRFGVTLFFFISGYLITKLMIAENQKNGDVAIGAFYARRFLRLAPALLFMITIVSLIYFVLNRNVDKLQIAAALVYMTNYFEIFSSHGPMPLSVLWSLAVEEHYYLVYPLVFVLAWKYRTRFLAGLSLLCTVVLLWRFVLVVEFHVSDARTYYATDTRIDSILYGAILAALMSICKPEEISRWFGSIAVALVGLSVLLVSFLYRDPVFRETLRYSMQGLALIPLFYSIVFSTRQLALRRLLEMFPMVWIGRISYSLYLWHTAILYFCSTMLPDLHPIKQSLLAVPFSFAFAAFSYYYIEKPFQRLRSRFRKIPDSAAADAQVETVASL